MARHELSGARLDRLDCGLRQHPSVAIPLVGQPRLDNHARAVVVGQNERMCLNPFEKAELLDSLDHSLTRDETIQLIERGYPLAFLYGAVRPRVERDVTLNYDPGVPVENIHHIEPVSPADLEIVEIVCRGELDRAAAKLGVGVFVGDNRDRLADQRQPYLLADEAGVSRIIRMHRDAGIA